MYNRDMAKEKVVQNKCNFGAAWGRLLYLARALKLFLYFSLVLRSAKSFTSRKILFFVV